jgi:hypothetical protein
MSTRQPSPLEVIEARVSQLAAALAVLAPRVAGHPADRASPPPASDGPDARALRAPAPPANPAPFRPLGV